MDRETFIQKLRELEKLLDGSEIRESGEMEEDQAEEIQYTTSCWLPACKLPGLIHSHLIPWYTSGFQ